MKRIKKRIFSGTVCEQIVYNVSEKAEKSELLKAKPRLRFKTEEEREKHKLGISRRCHARAFNANFSPTSLYSTLTLDDEHEVHTFSDAKRIRDKFIRRLKYTYPDAVIFAYLGRGKNTHRIHLHMVSEGVPEEAIIGKWGQGEIRRIEHLREHNYYNGVDHGMDYTGLADYLFNHWTQEQGGHRYKCTRNAKKCDREEATEARRNYTQKNPPIAPPGYILVEYKGTSYGYMYFKYILKPPPRRRNKSLVNV